MNIKKILKFIKIHLKRIKLLHVFFRKNQVPKEWRNLFLKSIFIRENKIYHKAYKILQNYSIDNYFKFNNLKISFYPWNSLNKELAKRYLLESYFIIIFPYLYGGNLYHLFSHIEANYYDDKKLKINPSDVVLDCGGFAGYFSIIAAKKAYNGKVIVIEPFHENIQFILKNIKLNNIKNIKVIEKAVGNKETDKILYFLKNSPSSSGIANPKRVKRGESRTIELTTIDHIFEKNKLNRVDFIKMDIEGMERYALLGARKVIHQFKPKLSICTYHLPDDPIILSKIIKSIRNDYKINFKLGKLYAY